MSHGRWMLGWSDGEQHSIASVEELERKLDELSHEAAKRPFMAVLTSPTGKALTVGLGHTEAVLQYQESPKPPYYASVGDQTAEGVLLFEFGGQETEVDRRHGVPLGKAREALRAFHTSDRRPSVIDWQEI